MTRKWIWLSPNGRDKNKIDFILTNDKRIFSEVDVVNKLNFNNNRMVRGVIQYINNKSRKYIILSTKNMMITSPIPLGAQNQLRNALEEIKRHKTLQEKYDFLEKALTKVQKLI